MSAQDGQTIWLSNDVDPHDEFIYADDLRAALGGGHEDTGTAQDAPRGDLSDPEVTGG